MGHPLLMKIIIFTNFNRLLQKSKNMIKKVFILRLEVHDVGWQVFFRMTATLKLILTVTSMNTQHLSEVWPSSNIFLNKADPVQNPDIGDLGILPESFLLRTTLFPYWMSSVFRSPELRTHHLFLEHSKDFKQYQPPSIFSVVDPLHDPSFPVIRMLRV